MIKLIASDMDGTLLDKNGDLSKDFFEVFKQLQQKGVMFAAASGRQYFQLIKNFEGVEDKIFYIAENGTLVKFKGEELYVNSISKELSNEIIEFILGLNDVQIVVCGKNSAYINTTNKAIHAEFDKYYFRYKVVEDFGDIKDDILKIAVLDLHDAENDSYVKLKERFEDKLQIVLSGSVWIDIFNHGTNKGTAIKLLQDKYSIKPEETMVFGDYYNDVEMLKAAHYSYAMEDAPDGVKKHAKYIAKSNDKNGVLLAIKEVVLKSQDKVC